MNASNVGIKIEAHLVSDLVLQLCKIRDISFNVIHNHLQRICHFLCKLFHKVVIDNLEKGIR